VLRFLHFYPSHQKRWPWAQRVRVRGELRGGFLGREMVHPAFKAVAGGAPLPQALTPVYPTSAQLPQAYLRKAVVSALARAPLGELLPPGLRAAGLPEPARGAAFLHHPPPDRRWPRWKTAATRPGSG
jgi:ATP-dependent DNA helicase RecG